MEFEELLSKLDRVVGFGSRRKARCPAHDDKVQSLSVSQTTDGKLLVKCHAGCATADVVGGLGITMKDLAGDRNTGGEEVARYTYTDAQGKVLYEKVRYEPKDFRWTPRGYSGPRVPYKLKEMLEQKRRVLWVEGEKDVETLIKQGFTATTAGSVSDFRPEMVEHFRGRYVTIIPDNDDPGRQHAMAVAANLAPVCLDVAILELRGLPAKGDVSDYFASGGTAQGLKDLLRDAKPFGKESVTSFASIRAESIDWLWYPRIARGAVTIVFGEAGIGKTTIMLDVLARLSRGDHMPNSAEGHQVTKSMVVGIEGPIGRVRATLVMAGANIDNVFLVHPDRFPEPDKMPLEQIDFLESQMKAVGASVLFVDNVTEVFSTDTDTHKESSVRAAMRGVTRLAERNGWSVIMISHPKKGAAFVSVKEAITGSQAITNLARTVLFVAPVLDEEGNSTDLRAIAMSKSNLAAAEMCNTLTYSLTSDELGMRDGETLLSVPRVTWRGVIDRDAQRLLSDMRPKNDKDEKRRHVSTDAAALFLQTLNPSPDGMSWSEVVDLAGGAHAEITLRRLRGSYLVPHGSSSAVRWFRPECSSPSKDSPSSYSYRREYTNEQDEQEIVSGVYIQPAEPVTPLAHPLAQFQPMSKRTVSETKTAALPVSSPPIPIPPVTNKTNEDVAREQERPYSSLTAKEREAKFQAQETTEAFLARMVGSVDES